MIGGGAGADHRAGDPAPVSQAHHGRARAGAGCAI